MATANESLEGCAVNRRFSAIQQPRPRRILNKYGAKKVQLDGFTFDSQGEARRYGELKLLEKQGAIHTLTMHPHYKILVNGKKICGFIPDFQYRDAQGKVHVEDFKGVLTPVFRLKAKLFKATHKIDVEIIR